VGNRRKLLSQQLLTWRFLTLLMGITIDGPQRAQSDPRAPSFRKLRAAASKSTASSTSAGFLSSTPERAARLIFAAGRSRFRRCLGSVAGGISRCRN
jgi:hypothetical protein